MDRTERMEFDIDLRLRVLWAQIEDVKEWDIPTLAAFFRLAYGSGYIDALREVKEGDAGRLCLDHGYNVP